MPRGSCGAVALQYVKFNVCDNVCDNVYETFKVSYTLGVQIDQVRFTRRSLVALPCGQPYIASPQIL